MYICSPRGCPFVPDLLCPTTIPPSPLNCFCQPQLNTFELLFSFSSIPSSVGFLVFHHYHAVALQLFWHQGWGGCCGGKSFVHLARCWAGYSRLFVSPGKFENEFGGLSTAVCSDSDCGSVRLGRIDILMILLTLIFMNMNSIRSFISSMHIL